MNPKRQGQIRYLLVSAVAWLMGLGFLAFIAFLIWKIFFEVLPPLATPYWYNFDETLKDVVNSSILPWWWVLLGNPWFIVIACIWVAAACIWAALWYFRKA